MIGSDGQRNLDDLGREAQFEVKAALHGLPQQLHVAIVNVPTVFAQMNGDRISAAEFGLGRRPDRIGLVGAASLPERRDVIDVDADFNHCCASLSTCGCPGTVRGP